MSSSAGVRSCCPRAHTRPRARRARKSRSASTVARAVEAQNSGASAGGGNNLLFRGSSGEGHRHGAGVEHVIVPRITASVSAPAHGVTGRADNSGATRIQKFGRMSWPFFALVELIALIGAATNGVMARRRRLQIEHLNGKLRELRKLEYQRGHEALVSLDHEHAAAAESAGSCTNLLSSGSRAMDNDEYEKAVGLYREALAGMGRPLSGVDSIINAGQQQLQGQHQLKLPPKYAAADAGASLDPHLERDYAAAMLGLSLALRSQGDKQGAIDTLVHLVSHMKGVLAGGAAEAASDSGEGSAAYYFDDITLTLSETWGTLGDLYTDIADVSKAAEAYDECISMTGNAVSRQEEFYLP